MRGEPNAQVIIICGFVTTSDPFHLHVVIVNIKMLIIPAKTMKLQPAGT